MLKLRCSTSDIRQLDRTENYGIECLLSLPAQIKDLNRIVRKYPKSFLLEDLVEAIFQASMQNGTKLEVSDIYEYIYDNCGYSVTEGDFSIENPDVDVLIKIAEEIYHQHVVFLHETIEDEESHDKVKYAFARFRLLGNLIHVEATLEFFVGRA